MRTTNLLLLQPLKHLTGDCAKSFEDMARLSTEAHHSTQGLWGARAQSSTYTALPDFAANTLAKQFREGHNDLLVCKTFSMYQMNKSDEAAVLPG